MLLNQQNSDSLIFKKSSLTLFILIICIYIAVRLWRLGAFGLWFDEVFSIHVARCDWGEIIPFAAQDIVHPPLFYLLLKVWIGVGGESLLWLRLFPALTSISTIVPFFLLCREFKLKAVEINTALLLIAVNGYLIYYSQELRMYSLLLFFTLVSVWLFVWNTRREDASKILLSSLLFANALLIYTQYFGWLVIGAQFLYVLFWKRHKLLSIAVTDFALALCFTPWVYLVSRAAVEKRGLGGNLGWLPRPRLADLVWYYATLHGAFDVRRMTTLGLIIFGGLLLLGSWYAFKRNKESKVWSNVVSPLALFSFLPVMFVFAVSQILPQSVWSDRYLIVAAVPYLILVTVATHQLPYAWGRVIGTSLIISWAAASNLYAITRDDRRLRWDVLAHTLIQAESGQAEGTRIYTFEEWVASPLRFYLESSGARRFEVVVIKDLTELYEGHFWVAFRDTTWHVEGSPQSILRNAGCLIERETYASDRGQKIILFSAKCDR